MVQILSLKSGESFKMGKGDSRRVIYPEMGAKHLTLNYSTFEPGQEFPQHIHDISEDIFIVLEGGVSVRQGQIYTPIAEGDVVFIPAGEVHGTINTTKARARLISFQGPPDPALYSGARDSSVTGKVPVRPTGHRTKIKIRRLEEGDESILGKMLVKKVVHPGVGSKNLALNLVKPIHGSDVPAHSYLSSEAVWLLLEGEVVARFAGKKSNPNRSARIASSTIFS